MAPNEPSCHQRHGTWDWVMQNHVYAASSGHPAGVNALMVDGSVQFYGKEVDLVLWRAMGTINGQDGIGLVDE